MNQIVLLVLILVNFSTLSFAQKPTEISKQSKTNLSKSALTKIPVKILYKPQAAYPNQNKGTVCIQGTVRIRVEFLESGEIRQIVVVSGLPYGASENAVEAAKKIKFIPAKKNGQTVTTVRVISFSFAIY